MISRLARSICRLIATDGMTVLGSEGSLRLRLTGYVAALAVVLAALAQPTIAVGQALPFLMPGDSRLRSMVQLDADSGKIPLSTTWPLPTPDLPAEERDALRGYNQPGSAADAGWFLSAADNPTKLRSFSDTPRENGEAGLQAGWAAGDYAGGAIRMSYAFDPEDGMHYRFDGTYAAYRWGNWWLTAGVQDRWWGPGWDSSLIFSSNARPMPGLGLERASSIPFETKWLRWLGPWRWAMALDHMENHRADYNNTLFWAGRFTFQPLHGLEIGISRTAQFCGQGKPCGLSTFFDMLIAKSNRAINGLGTPTPEQINQKKSAQRIATDLRWHIAQSPLSVYWQQYGEVFDSGNYRPRQTLQLFGAEFASWGVAEGRFRAFVEFADTACGGISLSSSDKPTFGCAYEKDTWQAGYRYRDRSIGDSMDRDGRRISVGFIYSDQSNRAWDIRLRKFELNRGNIAQVRIVPQTVTTVAEDIWNAELKVDGALGELRYSLGAGADHGGPVDQSAHWTGRIFLTLSKQW
jgi:Capsule assembly protein Wzi